MTSPEDKMKNNLSMMRNLCMDIANSIYELEYTEWILKRTGRHYDGEMNGALWMIRNGLSSLDNRFSELEMYGKIGFWERVRILFKGWGKK